MTPLGSRTGGKGGSWHRPHSLDGVVGWEKGSTASTLVRRGTGTWVPRLVCHRGRGELLDHLPPLHLPPAPTGQGCEHKEPGTEVWHVLPTPSCGKGGKHSIITPHTGFNMPQLIFCLLKKPKQAMKRNV